MPEEALDCGGHDSVVIQVPLSSGSSTSSFGHRRTEHLRPEKCALRLLDHLLVHALWRVVHDDRTSFVVNLSIQTGVSDQVDDPLLSF